MDVKDKIKKDIVKLEQKRQVFHRDYPTSYNDIARKYGYSKQTIFNIRAEVLESEDIKPSLPVNDNR